MPEPRKTVDHNRLIVRNKSAGSESQEQILVQASIFIMDICKRRVRQTELGSLDQAVNLGVVFCRVGIIYREIYAVVKRKSEIFRLFFLTVNRFDQLAEIHLAQLASSFLIQHDRHLRNRRRRAEILWV